MLSDLPLKGPVGAAVLLEGGSSRSGCRDWVRAVPCVLGPWAWAECIWASVSSLVAQRHLGRGLCNSLSFLLPSTMGAAMGTDFPAEVKEAFRGSSSNGTCP